MDLVATSSSTGTWYNRGGKRALDVALSFLGLVILAIPLAAVSMTIYLLDGPPIFFRQARVGRQGRLFNICKFRTMRPDSGPGVPISIAGDSRTTPVGRWLRRFKLDELPQLWNVLCGHMSLVGPRPDVPGYLDRLCGESRALWRLRPGITGPATLLFRREEEMLALAKDHVRFNDEVIYPEKVRLNLIYVPKCSMATDLAYLAATVAPVLSRQLGIDRRLGLEYANFEARMVAAARRYSV